MAGSTIIMIKNYFKTAIRILWRNKGYSCINISGLAMGMTGCILILFWVQRELNYDMFNHKSDRIYRVCLDAYIGAPMLVPVTSSEVGPTFVDLYPEVENAVRVENSASVTVKYGDRKFQEEDVGFADPSIFEIFTFPLISGDAKTALNTAYTVVISRDMAERYFDEEDAVGKILTIDGEFQYSVTGVMENIPENSHLKFNMIRSFETLLETGGREMNSWFAIQFYTYVLLTENADFKSLEQKFPDLVEEKLGPVLTAIGGRLRFFLQPLKEIHLYSNFERDVEPGGGILYVYLFSGIALMILLIACFNFINLATARSANRAKEVGLKKIFGANRGKLISQFMGESILMSLLAVLLTTILLALSLPRFSSITGYHFEIDFIQYWWILPGLFAMVLGVGLLAGAYPAFYLSSFAPVKVLHGSLATGASRSRFRQVLVILQFAISVSLIAGSITIWQQMDFVGNKNLGFSKDEVLVLSRIPLTEGISLGSLKQEFADIPGVLSVAASDRTPGRGSRKIAVTPEGFSPDEVQTVEVLTIDPDFLATLGIELVEGRNFSNALATDAGESVLLNERAVSKFGWVNGVGKAIKRPQPRGAPPQPPWRVIGIVNDFHMASLHTKIEPLLVFYDETRLTDFSLKINLNDVSRTISEIEKKWNLLFPEREFGYFFLEDSFARLYQEEKQLGNLVLYFSLLAVFIGCLGLFGLVSFTAEQRSKEIGIRKVLGASISSIVMLLSKEFMILVLISCLIAWPLAWYGLQQWLNNFAYHIKLGPTPLVISGLIALTISWLAVSYQALKAAMANPVMTIRNQ